MAFSLSLGSGDATVATLRSRLGISSKGYVTGVYCGNDGEAAYIRIHLADGLSDETTITNENVASLFVVEGNVEPTIAFTSPNITFTLGSKFEDGHCGAIMSDFVASAWKHSTCVLSNGSTGDYTSDEALPTYPVGTEQFLNGGDL